MAKTKFSDRLRSWQKSNNFTVKEAAAFLAVKLATYRHWLYGDCEPQGSKCRECVEAIIGN